MSKLVDAEDLLDVARHFTRLISMAASDLSDERDACAFDAARQIDTTIEAAAKLLEDCKIVDGVPSTQS
ncbi:MAG: hypothetical protein ABJO09_04335 [Hyphomicrobiales bacterium]|uniref:hypothetical protein n=1 Tax=Nisaea sp. TaxID=2024842 RepID=UPI00326FB4D3